VQDFIVLGLIPGTNYQITFIFWLWLMAGLSVALALLHYLPTHLIHLRTYLLARKVARLINHYELG
jgi:hypothetical protein